MNKLAVKELHVPVHVVVNYFACTCICCVCHVKYIYMCSRTGVQVIEMEKVDWIASKIFHSYYQSSLSDR